jgi:hypothetical protein
MTLWRGCLIAILTACGQPLWTPPSPPHYVAPAQTWLQVLPSPPWWSCTESGFPRPEADSLWIPNDSQTTRLEITLRRFLGARPHARPHRHYWRQYVAYVSDGRRLVFVSGVHDDVVRWRIDAMTPLKWQSLWTSGLYKVCDGGEYVYAALYDPHADRIVAFSFNHPRNKLFRDSL